MHICLGISHWESQTNGSFKEIVVDGENDRLMTRTAGYAKGQVLNSAGLKEQEEGK